MRGNLSASEETNHIVIKGDHKQTAKESKTNQCRGILKAHTWWTAKATFIK
jgi:hypothetical protein